MIDRFFVYVHRKADSGEIFYVGKGTRHAIHGASRARETRRRSEFWKRIVERHGLMVEVVAWFSEEGDAFEMERGLIGHFGRRGLGGCLCNMTDGGEGCSGIVMSEETRRKLREANSGPNAFNFGRKFPEEVGRKRAATLLSGPRSPVGKKLPPEWRASISKSKRGEKHPMWGKSGIDHHSGKMLFLPGYNLVLGSMREAADFLGMSLAGLQSNVTGKTRVNKTNLEFI